MIYVLRRHCNTFANALRKDQPLLIDLELIIRCGCDIETEIMQILRDLYWLPVLSHWFCAPQVSDKSGWHHLQTRPPNHQIEFWFRLYLEGHFTIPNKFQTVLLLHYIRRLNVFCSQAFSDNPLTKYLLLKQKTKLVESLVLPSLLFQGFYTVHNVVWDKQIGLFLCSRNWTGPTHILDSISSLNDGEPSRTPILRIFRINVESTVPLF